MIITPEVQNKLNQIKIKIIVSGTDNDIEIIVSGTDNDIEIFLCRGVYKILNCLLSDFPRTVVSAPMCVACLQLAVLSVTAQRNVKECECPPYEFL